MNGKNAIIINPERYSSVRGDYGFSAEEICSLIECIVMYLLDGIEPSGKSQKFLEAFEYLCEDAEAVYSEERT